MVESEFTWAQLLSKVIAHDDLSVAEASWAMDQVMEGVADPAILGGFLAALSTKGESVSELRGLADTMLAHAVRSNLTSDAVDIVGTGGDRLSTVNISTMASIVIAGAGVRVVKHGNRASSSKSGSADVLEALGIRLDVSVPAVERMLEHNGLAFLFANFFHPSMRHAAPTRRALGVRTAFNLLGPLTNPARTRATAIGVASERAAPLMAGVLADRGTSALVFRGRDNGLDELSTTTINQIWAVRDGQVEYSLIDLEAVLGFEPSDVAQLRGGDATSNANVARQVFGGEPGPIRDAVVANAAAAICAYRWSQGDQSSVLDGLRAGVQRAESSIASGAASAKLARWIELSEAAPD